MAQPEYWNDSSSTDTDEEWEEDAQMFALLVQQANASSSSIPRSKAPNIDIGRVEGNTRLIPDYFSDNPTYPEEMFKRRFRMSRNLFIRIVYDFNTRYPYFQQQYDAVGLPSFSPIQKCTAALRQLAYGITSDTFDEYVRMGDSTSLQCLNNFVLGIIQMYGKIYLRKPTYEDIQQLYAVHEERHGFPGMLGSLDYMHWEWANCPVAWQGQYHRGDKPHPSVILEAAASQDAWIWHALFGCPGAMNDLNVLNHSPLFEDVYDGKAPDRTFQVNGANYKNGYYLGDEIYPEWATFVKAFSYQEYAKRIKFKGDQEAARKDIERAFGILQKRWNIVKQPARVMEVRTMSNIMYACVILHNMIIENKNKAICVVPDDLPDPPNPQLTEEQRMTNLFQAPYLKVMPRCVGVADQPDGLPDAIRKKKAVDDSAWRMAAAVVLFVNSTSYNDGYMKENNQIMSKGKERVTEESDEHDNEEEDDEDVTNHHKRFTANNCSKNGYWVDFRSPKIQSTKVNRRKAKSGVVLCTDFGFSGSSSGEPEKPQDADYSINYTPSLSYELEGLILARFPRSEYWKISFVSRRFAGVVKSGELFKIRREIGFKEPSVFMLASGENCWWAFDQGFSARRRLPVLPSDICFTSGDKESLCAGSHLLVSGREIEGIMIWRYELSMNRWYKGPPMINPRCLFASATCGTSAYVAGGIAVAAGGGGGGTSGTQVVHNTVEKYDPETRSWAPLPRMKKPRKLCSGCYMDNRFYVIGGRNDDGELTCGEFFDPERNQWTVITGMLKDNPVLSCHSPPLIAVVNNELYSIEASSNQLKVYLKDSNSWKQLGSVPVRADYNRGWGVAFKSFGDELLVIGASTVSSSMAIYTCRPEPQSDRLPEWKLLDNGKIRLSHFIMNCSVMVA
ncbi:hypothetical protein OSB04_027022 [Centaurea solstitialis]|uniref:F-box/kelch-repeat protein n=1 Tax=Centaurea solstitialis TaxID=347529 RepID=A0AA38W9U5_9ASTR|nr:hypothetical protein OSB04_027022 [Centaurea solstitialis]